MLDNAPGRWTPAAFFRDDGGRPLCTLCAHGCRPEDGDVGLCGVRRRRGEVFETATRATAVRHLDPIEKKPLYHYRPGSQALTLAAPGCNFTCHYCLNYRLSQFGRVPEAVWRAEKVDAAAIAQEAAQLGADIALSYSEPSLAAELTMELATEGRAHGVNVLWKSNGFLTAEATAEIAPHLAAINLDLKSVDDRKHKALTGAPVGPILEVLSALFKAGVWIEISTPIIPKINDKDDDLCRIARSIRSVSANIPWHLIRFIPEFRMRASRPTDTEALRRGVEIGRAEGLKYVYVERALGADGRNTHCPECDEILVRRGLWKTEDVLMATENKEDPEHGRNGLCPACGSIVPGVWTGRRPR